MFAELTTHEIVGIVGDNVNRLVSQRFATRPLPPEKLRSFKRSVAAYEVIAPGEAPAGQGKA